MNNLNATNKKPYDLFPLLLHDLSGWVLKRFSKQKKLQFPQRIGDYEFREEMEKIGPRKSYLLAIYENGKGQKALAKMRDAKIKGYHYYSLLNEAKIYKILHNILMRNKKNLPKQFQNCYIPELVGINETKESLVILIEFVKGERAESLDPDKKIKLYFQMVDFLKFLEENMLPEEKKTIAVRKPVHYLILYPMIVIKSMVSYPENAIEILKSVPLFIKNIPAITKDSKLALVHRDLHFMNILLDEEKANLIDLQQFVMTEPLHEMITTLRYYWGQNGFYKLMWNEMLKRNKDRKSFKSLFQGYSINSVTHGLTGEGWRGEIADGWISFLRFVASPDYLKKNI